ncbi:MAG: hypothetical protein FDZ69_00305 [Deltaproteobacteria bacterium]|nr:MAG: hypothetical protein FDZ69_00305 [Deltaproteobacteria bacterium]
MSSRGSGGGWLTVILWLVVIGIVIEIVKLVVAVVGIALILTVSMVVLGVAVHGLGQFFDDVGNHRPVALKCVIPICIIGVAALLGGPKLLGLFQTETGMLWWHKTETHYFRLVLFILFATPVAFGFGYALADVSRRFKNNNRRTVTIRNNEKEVIFDHA